MGKSLQQIVWYDVLLCVSPRLLTRGPGKRVMKSYFRVPTLLPCTVWVRLPFPGRTAVNCTLSRTTN